MSAPCINPTWFDSIKLELENLSPQDLIEPQNELESSAHVVGVVENPELKKYFTLAMRWNREAATCVTHVSELGDLQEPREREEELTLATDLHKKSQILFDIFWTPIKDEYQLWDKDAVGIRRGWRVIYRDAEPPTPGGT